MAAIAGLAGLLYSLKTTTQLKIQLKWFSQYGVQGNVAPALSAFLMCVGASVIGEPPVLFGFMVPPGGWVFWSRFFPSFRQARYGNALGHALLCLHKAYSAASPPLVHSGPMDALSGCAVPGGLRAGFSPWWMPVVPTGLPSPSPT